MFASLHRKIVGFVLCLLFFGGFLIFLSADSARGAGNGSLYLSPSTSTRNIGYSFSLTLRVNTDGVAINAAEGSIIFDPAKVVVTSVSKSGSIFSLWADDPKYSNAEGTINFGGGVPNPGYSGSNGLVLTITFKAIAPTEATTISIVSGAILANDGEGTNILSSLGKSSFSIGGTAASTGAPLPVSGQANLAPSLVITSPTHPDQDKWYANKNPLLKWNLPTGTNQISLVFSKNFNTRPLINYSPPISEKQLNDLQDGIWYFSAQARTPAGLTPVSTFKIRIDTQPPTDFTIARSDQGDPTNPQPRLTFTANDALSGLDYYQIKVGDQDWLKVSLASASSPYPLTPQLPGDYSVLAQAYDKAGNFSIANYQLSIASIASPTIASIPDRVKTGELFNVSGKAETGQTVRLYAVNKNASQTSTALNEAPLLGESRVNDAGIWQISPKIYDEGVYDVFAKSVDNRGAISNPSSMASLLAYGAFGSNRIIRAFDKVLGGILDFVVNNWVWIVTILLILSIATLIAERFVPYLKKEFHRIRAITSEYQLNKKLQSGSRKTLAEVKSLSKDIKNELALLKKIEKHRPLNPDEKYLKAKIEQYIDILKMLK